MKFEGTSRSPPRSSARELTPLQQRKEAQALDGRNATADYLAVRRAQAENMDRLKALRLARDAANEAQAAAAPPPVKTRKRRRPGADLSRG